MNRRFQKIISRKFLVVLPKDYREDNNLQKGDQMVVWTGRRFFVAFPFERLESLVSREEILINALLSCEDPKITVQKILQSIPGCIEEKLGLNSVDKEQATIHIPVENSVRKQLGCEKVQDLGRQATPASEERRIEGG